MSPTFSGGGFAMDVMNADSPRDLRRVLAEYRIVPKKNPTTGSGLSKSDYTLERRGDKVGGDKHAVGTQTRKKLIQQLGIKSDADCERVRRRIKSHSQWGEKA